MRTRANKESRETLRTILARNYREMIEKHGEVALKRFPHISYGQDVNSETFKKSFPLSYKRYFFKLVRNIIVDAKTGQKAVIRKPPSLTITVGAIGSSKADPLVRPSMNTKMQSVRLGGIVRLFQNHRDGNRFKFHDPRSWRSRVFRRKDIKKKLRNLFMTFDEQDNCKFEPEVGTL
jgi:hypothetical protein